MIYVILGVQAITINYILGHPKPFTSFIVFFIHTTYKWLLRLWQRWETLPNPHFGISSLIYIIQKLYFINTHNF